MANLAFLSDNFSFGDNPDPVFQHEQIIIDLLRSLGHTVTAFRREDWPSDYTGFDAIVMSGKQFDITGFIDDIEASGLPYIVFHSDLAGRAFTTGSGEFRSGQTSTDIIDTSHPIMQGFQTGEFIFYQNGSFITYMRSDEIFPEVLVLMSRFDSGLGVDLITLAVDTTGGKKRVYYGPVNAEEWTLDTQTIFIQSIDWLLLPELQIAFVASQDSATGLQLFESRIVDLMTARGFLVTVFFSDTLPVNFIGFDGIVVSSVGGTHADQTMPLVNNSALPFICMSQNVRGLFFTLDSQGNIEQENSGNILVDDHPITVGVVNVVPGGFTPTVSLADASRIQRDNLYPETVVLAESNKIDHAMTMGMDNRNGTLRTYFGYFREDLWSDDTRLMFNQALDWTFSPDHAFKNILSINAPIEGDAGQAVSVQVTTQNQGVHGFTSIQIVDTFTGEVLDSVSTFPLLDVPGQISTDTLSITLPTDRNLDAEVITFHKE